jgi:hypothetical protein
VLLEEERDEKPATNRKNKEDLFLLFLSCSKILNGEAI